MKQNLLIILLLLLAFGCQEKTAEVVSIDAIFEEYQQFKDRINPIEATKGGNDAYNDFIANYISDPYQEDLRKNYSHFLELLSKLDTTALSEADLLSMKVMKWDCEVKLEGLNNPIVTMASPIYNLPSFELMPLFQIQSLHLYVAQLAAGGSVQPFETVEDYDNWLKRVDDYLIFLDTAIAKMKEGMAKEIVLPTALAQKMIPQLDEFITNPVEAHLFYKPILSMPESITEADKNQISAAYSKMIEDDLKPKYTELKEFMVNEYLPACRETSGIGALPNGPETYNYLIKLHTTTNLTADEIHELGKSEVARILIEMEEAKNKMGFKGDIKAFFESVRNSPAQMPFTDPQQVVDNFNSIKERINGTLNQVFDLKPKADFVVRRTEAFREASASAEYVPD